VGESAEAGRAGEDGGAGEDDAGDAASDGRGEARGSAMSLARSPGRGSCIRRTGPRPDASQVIAGQPSRALTSMASLRLALCLGGIVVDAAQGLLKRVT
jgi:hypothetical protein